MSTQRNDRMRCPCGGLLRVTNTCRGSSSSRAASAVCGSCLRRATIVSFVAHVAPGPGQGAAAIGRALGAGELVPCLAAPLEAIDAPAS